VSEARQGILRPDWGAVGPVAALTTTRIGGTGSSPFATLNLGSRTADQPRALAANRQRIRRALGLPADPCWLRQVHGDRVVRADADHGKQGIPEADAAWTSVPGVVCAVLTADCLPVVVAGPDGGCVAVAHAGWRSLAGGILENTVAALPSPAPQLRAWLGPAIGPAAFEVGPEVRSAFVERDAGAAVAFRRGRGDRWLGNLYVLARRRLRALGVADISGGGRCTVTERDRFFSHRRDGAGAGRMATLAWLRSA